MDDNIWIDFKSLAHYAYRLIEGDVDDILPGVFFILRSYNFVDENEEWIYPDDPE